MRLFPGESGAVGESEAEEAQKELADLLAREAGRENAPEARYADLYRATRIAEIHLQDDERAASLLETTFSGQGHSRSLGRGSSDKRLLVAFVF